MNGTMLQGFSWYLPSDGQHWRRMGERAEDLAERGITCVWLPPAYKGVAGAEDVGYGVYDLWDLGEFDQKGTVRTKYGTREEYCDAVRALQAEDIQVLGDVVLNHRLGGDEEESFHARLVAADNRTHVIEEGPEQVKTWSRFTFPGRAGKLDGFTWDHTCFTGTDQNELSEERGVWLIDGKRWAEDVDRSENGNFDYLMGMDVDLSDERVYEQLVTWGRWYLRTTKVNGFRLDALKHISRSFYRRWLDDMRAASASELFVVGEYWSGNVDDLRSYLGDAPELSLFDVPLHFNFFNASQNPDSMDLRKILDGSLLQVDPVHTVTFVENHDTQPNQSLSSTVSHWFKPAAYALILLREAGYPCVFFADLYGLPNDEIPAVAELPLLMEIRQEFSHGTQRDFFDDPDLIGWTREGSSEGAGCAVVLSRRARGERRMEVGITHAGETWVCVLGEEEAVTIDGEGWATFPAPATDALVSVYLPQDAANRLSNIPIIVRPRPEDRTGPKERGTTDAQGPAPTPEDAQPAQEPTDAAETGEVPQPS